MEMGGNFCQILELGGTTIKGRRVDVFLRIQDIFFYNAVTYLAGFVQNNE